MMSMARDLTMLFATLLGFWMLLNGSLAPDILVVGLIAAIVITFLFSNSLAVISELSTTPRALIAAVGYVFFFARELVKSNLNLARIVLSPALPLNPGIVKVRTRLKSRMGRLLLANSITANGCTSIG
jgi:multicomponent Na+:H+ antiporter subunit E